jgi:hypothetical protein
VDATELRDRARDNKSAFFFRLPFCAKSAMAEILVSDQRERRPPLLIGGRFRLRRAERRAQIFAGCGASFAQPGLFFSCI